MKATELKKVLAVGEVKIASDREVALLSLELYDDGLRIVWRVRFLDDNAERGTVIQDQATVADDKGTQYNFAGAGGTSGGNNDLWWAVAEFTPAVPDDTPQLVVEVGSLSFVARLR